MKTSSHHIDHYLHHPDLQSLFKGLIATAIEGGESDPVRKVAFIFRYRIFKGYSKKKHKLRM